MFQFYCSRVLALGFCCVFCAHVYKTLGRGRYSVYRCSMYHCLYPSSQVVLCCLLFQLFYCECSFPNTILESLWIILSYVPAFCSLLNGGINVLGKGAWWLLHKPQNQHQLILYTSFPVINWHDKENIFIPGKHFIIEPIQLNIHFSTSCI